MMGVLKIPEQRKEILKKDLKNRKMLEEHVNIKIQINEGIDIEGESFNVFQAKRILEAFGRGFEIKDCLSLLEDDYGLEIIHLPNFVRSKNRMEVIKGRIIGTEGKTKKYIERYTNTKISVYGKTVSIIGKWNDLEAAKKAVMMLVHGSTHKTLYRWLERRTKVVNW